MQRYRRIILSIMIFLLASLAGCSSCNDPHGSPVPDSSLAPASDTPSDKPTAASEFAYAYGTYVSGGLIVMHKTGYDLFARTIDVITL